MAPTSSTSFTARETELLTIAFQCLKGKPDIDYDLFAAKANLKGAKSARDSFTPLYNKIVAGLKTSGAVASANGGENGGSEPSSSPKKKSTPRKRRAGGNDSEGENSSPTKKATPSKKTKGQKKKNKPVAAASDDDGDEAEDSIVVKSEFVEPQAESDE